MMTAPKKQPGYRVTEEAHKLVLDHAEKMSEELGFAISTNKALEHLIKVGHRYLSSNPQFK